MDFFYFQRASRVGFMKFVSVKICLLLCIHSMWVKPCLAQGEHTDDASAVTDSTTGRSLIERGDSIHVVNVQGPDTLGTGSRVAPKRNVPHGTMDLGMIHGLIPYTDMQRGALNGFLRGTVSQEILGVPLRLSVDLGTDVPIRGQRNTVRLSFDPPRVIERDSWADAKALHTLNARMDSLGKERAKKLRLIKGLEDRGLSSGLNSPTIPPTTNVFGDMAIGGNVPSVPELTDSIPTDSLFQVPPIVPGADTLNEAGTPHVGFQDKVNRYRTELSDLDREKADLEMQIQRLKALMHGSKGQGGLATRVAHGIKRLEVGTCAPASSEFLINGVTFQGLSFEYARNDLFLSFDRGRSFDETWMDADPVSRNLRMLHQSLFFSDAQDLNPRKLTAVRVGYGERQRTHLHIGYLTGNREDLPMGVLLQGGGGSILRNHVVEFDAGYAPWQGHLLRIVYARSAVGPVQNSTEGESRTSVSGLFDPALGNDQAAKLLWTSEFKRTRTRADIELRSISPMFQSYGLAFVRNGSRAVEGKLDQPLGERWRLRGRYTMEERSGANHGTGQSMSLQRGQTHIIYRPTKSIAIRTGYIPVSTKVGTPLGVVESSNKCLTVGTDIRKRWKKLIVLARVDVAQYSWASTAGIRQQMFNRSAELSLQKGERWNVRMNWTDMSGSTDTLALVASNLSVHTGYRTKGGIMADAALYAPNDAPYGWSCGLGVPVRKGVTLRVRGERFSRNDILFSTDVWTDRSSDYTWTMIASFAW
jgi:hypothetical protein